MANFAYFYSENLGPDPDPDYSKSMDPDQKSVWETMVRMFNT